MAKNSYIERTAAKLEVDLKEFDVNMKYFEWATYEEMRSVVVAGAAAFATLAATKTPPCLGQQDISPAFYSVLDPPYVLPKGYRTNGMRIFYNLREAIKNPQTKRWKKMFGAWLREGYEYCVVIHSSARQRKGRWTYIKPLHTRSEVAKYVHEDYRGLMRAAWGMGFMNAPWLLGGKHASAGNKMPPPFNKYLKRRPALYRLRRLSTAYMLGDKRNISIVLRNDAIPSTANFIPALMIGGNRAAVRAMNREMSRFNEQKYNI